jgi:hypothetical protein
MASSGGCLPDYQRFRHTRPALIFPPTHIQKILIGISRHCQLSQGEMSTVSSEGTLSSAVGAQPGDLHNRIQATRTTPIMATITWSKPLSKVIFDISHFVEQFVVFTPFTDRATYT